LHRSRQNSVTLTDFRGHGTPFPLFLTHGYFFTPFFIVPSNLISYQAIDEPSPTSEPAHSELGGFPDEPEYARRSQTPSPYGVSSYTGLASFTSGETIHASRDIAKICRSPLQPPHHFTQSPESNTLRARPMSSSPPTLFHLSPGTQSDARYALRQLPSFDAPMHSRTSVHSKHRRSDP